MPTRGGSIAMCCAALVLLRIITVAVALDGQATSSRHSVLVGDVKRYHQIAARRGTPYADFEVEYPPLTLAAIDALDRGTLRQSIVRVMWSQLALDGLVALLLAWGWGRRAALAYLLLGLAFAWYPFLYLRLDLLSVTLAVGGLALVRRTQVIAGGATVALACFAKIWPLALVPLLVARRSWRALGACAAVGIAGAVAWVGWAGTDGPVQVLTFRGAKGWQVESMVGAVVHVLATEPARVQRGAERIGVVPDMLRVGLPVLGLLATVIVGWLLWRIPRPAVHVVDGVAPIAAVAAMLVCATILSPQYVAWLLPFVAIAAAGGERVIGWLTATVAFLSTVGLNLVKEIGQGVPIAMTVVLARNAVLLTLLVVAVVRLVRVARSSAAVPALVAATASPAAGLRRAAGIPAAPGPGLSDSADGRSDDRRSGARL